MASVNQVVIVGNLTRDPELRSLSSGTSVCELGVAVNERYKSGDEWQDRAHFFDITVWGAQGESCAQYLTKGRQVAIVGRLQQDRWEDKETGKNRSKVKITANTVQFLGGKPEDGNGGGGGGGQATASAPPSGGGTTPPPSDDGIPF